MSDTELKSERIVAIVGRPNVGKSAIFNRIVGKRISIVHAQSGVTRDRVISEANWDDDLFELVDTGGMASMDSSIENTIDEGILGQVKVALQDATVAILTVDIDAGLCPLDEEVARVLRKQGIETFVAVNKADHFERDKETAEFNRLGFPVFAVSALHNRGFGDLMDEVVKALPKAENPTEKNPVKVAVVGRPNVGKSSYINRLLNAERVIVSDIPGTTRDSIDIPFTVGSGPQARHYLLIDTAGIRRMGKVKNAVERYSHYRSEQSIRRADIVVFIVDADKGPTAQDKKIAAMILENNKGCVLLINKWDLAEKSQREFGAELPSMMPPLTFAPVMFMSAETGLNVRKTITAIDHVAAQINATLPTGILNRAIQTAHKRVSAPAVNGKRFKIYYSTQVGIRPLRVALFVNDPKIVQPQYKSFLVKAIRASFGLEGAPILIQCRRRKKDDRRTR